MRVRRTLFWRVVRVSDMWRVLCVSVGHVTCFLLVGHLTCFVRVCRTFDACFVCVCRSRIAEVRWDGQRIMFCACVSVQDLWGAVGRPADHVLCACVGPGSRRCRGTASGSCFVCVCRSRIAKVRWDGQRIMFCVRVSVQDRGGAVGRPADHVLRVCRSRIVEVRWDGQRIMFCVCVSVQDRGGAVGRPADHVLCVCVGPGSRRCGGTASGSCFVCVCRPRIAEVRWDGQRIMFCVCVSVQDRGGAVGRPEDHVLCACVGPGSRRCGGTARGSCFVCVCRSRIAEVRWDGQRIMFCVCVSVQDRGGAVGRPADHVLCVCRSRITEVQWDGQRIMFCARVSVQDHGGAVGRPADHVLCACVGPGSRRCSGTARGSCFVCVCRSRIAEVRWDGQRIMFCVRVSVQDRGGAVGRPADHVLCACVGPGSRRCSGTASGSCFVCVCRSRITEVRWDGQRIMFCVRVSVQDRGGAVGRPADHVLCVCVGPGSRRCGGTASGSCFVCVCRSRIAEVRWDGQRIMFCVRVSVQDRGGAVGRPEDHVLCACVGPGSRRCGGTASGSCFVCVCRSRIAEVRWDGQRIMFCVRVSVQDHGGAVGRPEDHVLCACVGPGSRRCGGTARGSCFVCVCRSRITEVRWDGQRIMFCARVGPGSRRCGGTASGSCFVCVCRFRIAEVRWDGQRIVVLDQVFISPPYQVDNCTSKDEGQALQHVRKLVPRPFITTPPPSSLSRPLHHYPAPQRTPQVSRPMIYISAGSAFAPKMACFWNFEFLPLLHLHIII